MNDASAARSEVDDGTGTEQPQPLLSWFGTTHWRSCSSQSAPNAQFASEIHVELQRVPLQR